MATVTIPVTVSTGTSTCRLERLTVGGASWSTVDSKIVPVTQLVDATAVAGTTYRYRAVGVSPEGYDSPPSNVVEVAVPAGP